MARHGRLSCLAALVMDMVMLVHVAGIALMVEDEEESDASLELMSKTNIAYAHAAKAGLDRHKAASVGVEWAAAGLPSMQLIGGIDSECDSDQFDSLEMIDKKAKYACESGLAGMMNWRLDNDYMETPKGDCAKGWPKPEGTKQTFKGAYRMRDAVNKYCEGRKQKPVIASYIGFGINYDIMNDTWHARKGKELYKDLPYDAVDRIYLAFADVQNCEFKDLPAYMKQMLKYARKTNPRLEVYLTSSTASEQYSNKEKKAWCSSKPETSVRFTQTLRKTLDKYKLNGYDIDWEDHIDQEAYTNLLQQVKHSFKDSDYKLTMAVWPYYNQDQYNLPAIRSSVDQVNLMSYGGFADMLKKSATSFMQTN